MPLIFVLGGGGSNKCTRGVGIIKIGRLFLCHFLIIIKWTWGGFFLQNLQFDPPTIRHKRVGGLSSDEEQEIDNMLTSNYERWAEFYGAPFWQKLMIFLNAALNFCATTKSFVGHKSFLKNTSCFFLHIFLYCATQNILNRHESLFLCSIIFLLSHNIAFCIMYFFPVQHKMF